MKMKNISFLDLVLIDRSQISFEMGTNSRDYVLTTKLGMVLDISYIDGILHFSFEGGEIRLELEIEDLIHFLNLKFR
jgi:hypothetical protein